MDRLEREKRAELARDLLERGAEFLALGLSILEEVYADAEPDSAFRAGILAELNKGGLRKESQDEPARRDTRALLGKQRVN
jgi:hypothetical protein